MMILNGNSDERGSHAQKRGILVGVGVNEPIGGCDGIFQRFSAVFLCGYSAEALDESVDGKTAGDFAGGCSAHAIADGENTRFRTATIRVFVDGSYFAGVGERGSLKSDG
jgi:hypothetical protein